MYKRILVAVDGGETANAALQEAIKLAKDDGSQIRLLHVVDLTMAYSIAEAPTSLNIEKRWKSQARVSLPAAQRGRGRRVFNSILNA